MMPSRDLQVKKLSDEFGQYQLILKCAACAHERRAHPRSLANILGWDTPIAEVEKRLRCSKCGSRGCQARAIKLTPPRRAAPSH